MCFRQAHDRRGWQRDSRVALYDLESVLDGGYLVSDAEREAALAALRRHAADGRLTLEEFGLRTDEALTARNAEQLRAALRDLPRPERGTAGRAHGGRGRIGLVPLPVLLLVLAVLIAGHGWALIPLAWLLFAAFGPWSHRRRHEGRHERQLTL